MNSAVAIDVKDLTLGYNHHIIVKDINLTITAGEFIAILGPNGSGKSTFLRALLGLITPLSGKICIFGASSHIDHSMIGYMPQSRYANFANLSSKAILEATYDGMHWGLPLPSLQKTHSVNTVLKLVKAEGIANQPLKDLSGGEKQRIHLAQALLNSPKILLLDEPLSNLDPHFQETFIHILGDIKKHLNATILFTAHDPNPLLPIMDRVLFFAKGKFMIGSVEEIITSDSLSRLYETPINVIQHNQRLYVLGDHDNIFGHEAHHD